MLDMNIEVLKEIIEDQASEIKILKKKLKHSRSDNKVKTKKILQSSSDEIERTSRANEKMILDLTERVAAQALMVDSLTLEKSLLLKSNDELNKTILHLQVELQRKEDFIAISFSESSAIQHRLTSEKSQLSKELDGKSCELEQSLADLNAAYEMLAELERASEENETVLLKTILELDSKVRTTFDEVLKVEEQYLRAQRDISARNDEAIQKWEKTCQSLQLSKNQLVKQV